MSSISGPGDVPPSWGGNSGIPLPSNPGDFKEVSPQNLSQGKLIPVNHPFVKWVEKQFHNVNKEQARAVATAILNAVANMIGSQISHMTQVLHERHKENLRLMLDE